MRTLSIKIHGSTDPVSRPYKSVCNKNHKSAPVKTYSDRNAYIKIDRFYIHDWYKLYQKLHIHVTLYWFRLINCISNGVYQ